MAQPVVHASSLNLVAEVRHSMSIPKKITVCDCTLREGEQSASASLGLEQKVELARRLIDAGLGQLQVGYPGRSAVDMRAVRAIKELAGDDVTVEVVVQAFTPDWQRQIDMAIDSGPDVMDLMYPGSDLRIKYVQQTDRQGMFRRSMEALRYAVGRGVAVRFTPTDTTRADLDFLKRLYKTAVEEGAERVGIADTAGAISPPAMSFLVREVAQAVSVPIQVHCHNDFGLALANALAAVAAGASIVDACVNGLGERAGNVSLDELVMALEVLYGVKTGINTTALRSLSIFVAEMTGVPVPPSKPLVGDNAFAHKLDAHVEGVLAYPGVYEVIDPVLIGNRRRFPIGKYSGPAVLKAKLAEMNLPVPEEERLVALSELVEQRAIEKGMALTDEELADLARRL